MMYIAKDTDFPTSLGLNIGYYLSINNFFDLINRIFFK